MDPTTLALLVVAGVLVLGVIGESLFERTQIPDVLWLIAAGALLGPVTGLVDPHVFSGGIPTFAAVTLVVILFQGGSRLVLRDLLRSAPRAAVLAVIGWLLSAAAVAGASLLAAHFGLLPDWSVGHALMLGSMLGGSSSLVIMPSMEVAGVDDDLANLVGLESALTDALCVVSTLAMIEVLATGAASPNSAIAALALQFGVAIGLGICAGMLWIPMLNLIRNHSEAYPLTLAALLGVYALADLLGGNGALAILAFAIVVGNADALLAFAHLRAEHTVGLDARVRAVHSVLSFVIKSLFFTFIGLMLGPPWPLLLLGLGIAVLLLPVRFPAVLLATVRSRFDGPSRLVASVSLPRGMASGVLATLPAAAGIPGTEFLPSLVFATVVGTILIFGVAFPLVRRRVPTLTNPGERPQATPPGPEPPSLSEKADVAEIEAMQAREAAAREEDQHDPEH
ncbi:MAG: cation:proton antiporter [Deltaproteobacteria bacterium]|nr:cation:proton antiporter [Deltaproteobacteria bacterium]MCB9785233.1 cation:proton antiporter [Deltaproteobacteria bacterium]